MKTRMDKPMRVFLWRSGTNGAEIQRIAVPFDIIFRQIWANAHSARLGKALSPFFFFRFAAARGLSQKK
jgi:hypothetical protein